MCVVARTRSFGMCSMSVCLSSPAPERTLTGNEGVGLPCVLATGVLKASPIYMTSHVVGDGKKCNSSQPSSSHSTANGTL